MINLLVVVASAGFGLGLYLVFLAISKRDLISPSQRPSYGSAVHELFSSVSQTKLGFWAVGALLAAVATLISTGWPIAALAVAVTIVAIPFAMVRGRQRKQHGLRSQAVATWVEMIRDNISAAAGLEQATQAAALMAPKPIGPELASFSQRLESSNLNDALAALKQDLDNPSADLVITALQSATSIEVRDLGSLLTRLSTAAREEVRMYQRIEVSRARIRASAQIVLVTTIGTILLLFAFGSQILEPYGTLQGQLWMLMVFIVLGVGAAMLERSARIETPQRFKSRSSSLAFGRGTRL